MCEGLPSALLYPEDELSSFLGNAGISQLKKQRHIPESHYCLALNFNLLDSRKATLYNFTFYVLFFRSLA